MQPPQYWIFIQAGKCTWTLVPKWWCKATALFSSEAAARYKVSSSGSPAPNITANGPISLNLQGTSATDIVATVADGSRVILPSQTTLARISQGRVELGSGTWLDPAKARVIFLSSVFTCPTGNTGSRYKAVLLNGQSFDTNLPSPSIVSACTFSYGDFGLYARNITTTAKAPKITNCTFGDCYYGLGVNGKSAIIENCTFDRNVFGTYLNAVSGISYLQNTKIRGTVAQGTGTSYYMGLYVKGNGGSVYLRNTEIRKYQTGSWFYSSGNQYVICAKVQENQTGFHVRGGSLRMGYGLGSTTNGIAPGHVDASDNQVAMRFQHALMPVLNQGNDDLRAIGGAGSWIATGSFNFTGPINMWYNRWKTTGGAPVNGIDYSFSTAGVSLLDPGPIAALPACPTSGPPAGAYRPWQGLGITINTPSFENVLLDVAMDQAADLLYGPDQEIESPLAAANLFHEILAEDYNATTFANTPMLQISLDLSLAAMREALAEGIERDLIPSQRENYPGGELEGIPAKYSEAALLLADRYEAADARPKRVFQTRAERALMFSMIGWEDKAAEELEALYSIADADDQSFLNHWICQMNLLRSLRSGEIDVYTYEAATENCPALSENAPAARPSAPAPVAETPTAPKLALQPNPAQESVLVQWGRKEATTLSLYAADGRNVLEMNMEADAAIVDLRSLPAGVYLVQVRTASGGVQTARLAVQR